MDREKEYGLIHVTLSRVIKFLNLGIKDTKGISKNRLYRKIYNHPKIKKIINKEILRNLEELTIKYVN